MGSLEGKVAFVTGVARGQGRSHAIGLARQGANIIGVDICDQIKTVPYPLSTRADLDETEIAVQQEGRGFIGGVVDVRNSEELDVFLRGATAQLGGLDIVVANAGISPIPFDEHQDERDVWNDVMDVNLTGVWNTVRVSIDRIMESRDRGSIILTSSTAGLKGHCARNTGELAYTVAKHGLVGMMRGFATRLAPQSIRVNSIHPTGVATPMIVNPVTDAFVKEHPESLDMMMNALPVEMIEAYDVTEAVIWLASDASRYVTGVTLPVDAGFALT